MVPLCWWNWIYFDVELMEIVPKRASKVTHSLKIWFRCNLLHEGSETCRNLNSCRKVFELKMPLLMSFGSDNTKLKQLSSSVVF